MPIEYFGTKPEEHTVVCGWEYNPRLDAFLFSAWCRECRGRGEFRISAHRLQDPKFQGRDTPSLLQEVHQAEEEILEYFSRHQRSWEGSAEEIIGHWLRVVRKKEIPNELLTPPCPL